MHHNMSSCVDKTCFLRPGHIQYIPLVVVHTALATQLLYRLAASMRVPTPVHTEPEEEEGPPCNTVITLPKITRWVGGALSLAVRFVLLT